MLDFVQLHQPSEISNISRNKAKKNKDYKQQVVANIKLYIFYISIRYRATKYIYGIFECRHGRSNYRAGGLKPPPPRQFKITTEFSDQPFSSNLNRNCVHFDCTQLYISIHELYTSNIHEYTLVNMYTRNCIVLVNM